MVLDGPCPSRYRGDVDALCWSQRESARADAVAGAAEGGVARGARAAADAADCTQCAGGAQRCAVLRRGGGSHRWLQRKKHASERRAHGDGRCAAAQGAAAEAMQARDAAAVSPAAAQHALGLWRTWCGCSCGSFGRVAAAVAVLPLPVASSPCSSAFSVQPQRYRTRPTGASRGGGGLLALVSRRCFGRKILSGQAAVQGAWGSRHLGHTRSRGWTTASGEARTCRR